MRRFSQVDVFTSVAYRGNPLAVVVDGGGLSDDEMRSFANWTNLSETTFLMPSTDPAADYKVRIFTTSGELPFAGHPTIGSCHAWLESGGVPASGDKIVQECGVGLVELARHDGRLGFAAPKLIRSGKPTEAEIAQTVRVLGIHRDDVADMEWIDNGPGWIGVLLENAQAVLDLTPEYTPGESVDIGVAGLYPPGAPVDLEVRAFFQYGSQGMEDPVTGSLNASLAQWLIGNGTLPASYVAAQGRVLGRDGSIYLKADGGRIWVSGDVVTCISGEVTA